MAVLLHFGHLREEIFEFGVVVGIFRQWYDMHIGITVEKVLRIFVAIIDGLANDVVFRG